MLLHMCSINEDHMMYSSWNIRHDKQSFFVILGHFLFFNLPNNLKNQTFEKMKKKPTDIIILHLHTTNDDHMMHGFWDMEHDRQNLLSFWTIFSRTSKFWKSEKNTCRYYHFTNVYHKWKPYDAYVCFLRYGVWQT